MKVVGLAVDRRTGIYTSDGVILPPINGRPFDVKDFIKPIIELVNGRIGVFSKLDWDVAGLISIMAFNDWELDSLAKKESVRFRPDYKVTYFPDKYFGLDDWSSSDHAGARFYDACQYDQSLSEIEDRTDAEYWFDRAKKAAVAGQAVADCLSNMGYEVTTLSSPAAVFSKNVLSKMSLPKYTDCPEEASKFAYNTIVGNWVEAFKLGHFEQTWDYDINSAYCYQAANLLDTRRGQWVHSTEYQTAARYGYARCEVHMESAISPIIYQAVNDDSPGIDDRNYTPQGTFEAYLTKGMIDFVNDSQYPELKDSHVTVLDGWWWIPTPNAPTYTPLKGVINYLFSKKQKAIGAEREVIKRIMNGAFYGVFSQTRRDTFGDFFFPAWAAEIEANNRIMVARACLESGVMPIHVAVDGILSEKPLNVKIGDLMGEWKLSHQGKALVINTNARFIEGKVGDRASSLAYDRIIGQIKADPDAEEYPQTKVKVLTVLEAFKQGRPGDIGKIVEVKAMLSVNSETKRLYLPAPSCGRDVLNNVFESMPMSIGRLELIQDLRETSLVAEVKA